MNVRWLFVVASVLCLSLATTAAGREYASSDRPGPTLETPQQQLRGALECSAGVAGAPRAPVLLIAGTGATPRENFGWNYMPALSRRGVPWCAITVPEHTLADVQVQGEHIVWAVREVHRIAGLRISILGFSQGGMTPRWALRFWPDIRPMVDDMISLAADNHGTTAPQLLQTCAQACPAAAWQNTPGSALLHALNHPVETFGGISYSQIFTNFDQLSTPAGRQGTSPLHTGAGTIANVALQDVCPTNVADHILIGSVDPVAWALVNDALDHDGPAAASRVDRAWCSQAVLPGADLAGATAVRTAIPYLFAGATAINLPGVRRLSSEPPLRCYVFADCGTGGPSSTRARLTGPPSRPGLVAAAEAGAGSPKLRSLAVSLPPGFRVGRLDEVRRRADGSLLRRSRARAGGRRLVVRVTGRGATRLSLRALDGALAIGPRSTSRLRRGRGVDVVCRATDVEGNVHRSILTLRAATGAGAVAHGVD